MAHELTHALEDQSYQIDPWIKSARPNDDAELARESVSEGSAMAAMVDYSLREQHIGVRDLPDVTLLLQSGAVEEMSKDPASGEGASLYPGRSPVSSISPAPLSLSSSSRLMPAGRT